VAARGCCLGRERCPTCDVAAVRLDAAHRLRLGPGQQHGKLGRRFHRVWQIGRHIEQVAGFERVWFAHKRNITFAGQDLNCSVLRGGGLRSIPGLRRSRTRLRVSSRCVPASPAPDAAGDQLGFLRHRNDVFVRRIHHRLFTPECGVARAAAGTFDANQTYGG